MFILISFVVLSIFRFQEVLAANILFVSTMASPSHHTWNKALILGLIEKGHNVTSLTHLSEASPTNNWTIITIEGLYDVLPKTFDMKTTAESSVLKAIKMIYDYPRVICEYDMKSQGLQTLLEYPSDTFDLIVFDTTLGQCMYPLIARFNNPPVVAAYLLPLLASRSFGSHIYSSYMPYFSSGFSDEMTIVERVLNFIFLHVDFVYYHYVVKPTEFKIAQKRFGDDIRPFDEVENNISLVLTNIDPNLDYPISLSPNVIPVGGLHIKPAGKLPPNLQKHFDEAKHGVILVSFGTNVNSESFAASMPAFMNAFGRLNQTVIWKYKANSPIEFPKNVIPISWLPQMDILGHPNLKLFISQCGGFSYQEAIYNGVPIVAIPFLIDQYTTAARLSKRRLAVKLDHWDLTADKIYDAIIEVLNNPIYRENMKIASEKYRDQPQTPLERGLFWIEYVLRHGNAEHLVPITRNMPMYQLANFDVFLFMVAAFVLAYAILTFLLSISKIIFTLIAAKIKLKACIKSFLEKNILQCAMGGRMTSFNASSQSE